MYYYDLFQSNVYSILIFHTHRYHYQMILHELKRDRYRSLLEFAHLSLNVISNIHIEWNLSVISICGHLNVLKIINWVEYAYTLHRLYIYIEFIWMFELTLLCSFIFFFDLTAGWTSDSLFDVIFFAMVWALFISFILIRSNIIWSSFC